MTLPFDGPCKDCKPPIRHPACHDSCVRYIKYSTERNALRSSIRESERAYGVLDSIAKTNIRKALKCRRC